MIDLEFIQKSTWKKALKLTKDIDEFDTPFIALELKAPLWTGDKKLIKGLSKSDINWLYTTEMMTIIRD